MMLDELVTTDLAALARDGRQYPIPLAETLRRCTTRDRGEPASELALVAMSSVFVARVARSAAGAMALVVSGALALLWFTFERGTVSGQAEAFTVAPFHVGVMVLFAALVTYRVTAALAARTFDRRIALAREPQAAARVLVGRASGPAIALVIAGATATVTLVGVAWFTLGHEEWRGLFLRWGSNGAEATATFADRLRDVAIAMAVAVALAITVARRAGRLDFLAHRRVIVIGIVVGVVTVCAGLALDPAPFGAHEWGPWGMRPGEPSSALRSELTAWWVVAQLIAFTAWTLRQRRREDDRCGL